MKEWGASEAVAKLRAALPGFRQSLDCEEIVAAKTSVMARFQPIFSLDHLHDLTAEEFRSFLYFENNKHWGGLYRQGLKAANDLSALRRALTTLLDESAPIDARLDKLLPGGKALVPGMGRAILTAILLVAYPERYGVWNQTSQQAMRDVGLWPQFPSGAGFGKRYTLVNGMLLKAAASLDLDLWTLDSFWWFWCMGRKPPGLKPPESEPPEPEDTKLGFGLERYLHEFLRDNWDQTSLGKEWALHEEDGELVGFKYATERVGEIDLLARHRRDKRWLVIELKRGQTSDDTVGQILRYMGWVEEHLAKRGESVEGLIVAREIDDKLKYALKRVQGVQPMLYHVNFHLRDAGKPSS